MLLILAQELQMNRVNKKENILKMCILYILTSGMMFATSGCYAGVEVVEPHSVVYTSYLPTHVEVHNVNTHHWTPYTRYQHRRYHRVHRRHHHRVRYHNRVRVQRHHNRPRLKKRVVTRRYNNRGKLRRKTVRRTYRY